MAPIIGIDGAVDYSGFTGTETHPVFTDTKYIKSDTIFIFRTKRKGCIGFFGVKESNWFDERISSYPAEILEHYHQDVFNMYTKEDFLRDHPPESQKHFLFPWEEEYHRQEIKKTLNEGELKGKLENLEELYRDGLLSKEEFLKRSAPLREKLQALGSK